MGFLLFVVFAIVGKGKSNDNRKNRSRFPSGMTKRKARATTKRKARATTKRKARATTERRATAKTERKATARSPTLLLLR
jgi:hypothetical protein